MPEEKSNPEPSAPCGCTRRTFEKLGIGALAVAGVGAAAFGYEYLAPNVLYEPSPITNAGKPDQYPSGSVTTLSEAGVYLIHGPQGFYALSATCTHLGCRTAWAAALGIIACPCHGSKFNIDGIKIAGPAPRPLPWLRVWISDDGDLMVDHSVTVAEQQFLRV